MHTGSKKVEVLYPNSIHFPLDIIFEQNHFPPRAMGMHTCMLSWDWSGGACAQTEQDRIHRLENASCKPLRVFTPNFSDCSIQTLSGASGHIRGIGHPHWKQNGERKTVILLTLLSLLMIPFGWGAPLHVQVHNAT